MGSPLTEPGVSQASSMPLEHECNQHPHPHSTTPLSWCPFLVEGAHNHCLFDEVRAPTLGQHFNGHAIEPQQVRWEKEEEEGEDDEEEKEKNSKHCLLRENKMRTKKPKQHPNFKREGIECAHSLCACVCVCVYACVCVCVCMCVCVRACVRSLSLSVLGSPSPSFPRSSLFHCFRLGFGANISLYLFFTLIVCVG